MRNGNTSTQNAHRQAKQQQQQQQQALNNNLNQQQQQALANHAANTGASEQQQQQQAQQAQQEQQQQIHNLQFSQLNVHAHHGQNMQTTDNIYISHLGQNYATNANSYDIGSSMPAVIQQRMSINQSINSHGAPTVRVEQPSPSCAVNNFYLQNNLSSNAEGLNNSSTRVPISIPSGGSSAGSTPNDQLVQHQVPRAESLPSAQASSASVIGNLSSLSRLQQLTNGLDIPTPCNTSPLSGQVDMTPPPPQHGLGNNSMTPPPHLIVSQNRNLNASPNMLQSQMASLQYHKYYSSNMNIPPITTTTSQTISRTVRNTPSAPLQHISSSPVSTPSPNSSRAANVHLAPPNLMTPYSAINSYRMSAAAAQQGPGGPAAGYGTGGEYPNSQIPMQMGVMNMQSQYQDACAIQRAAAQQNSMYSTYSPYIPLNTPMRR